MTDGTTRHRVDLYWLPLGAGGRCVRLNGRAFEAVVARRVHQRACHLYHSALEVRLDANRWVIEMAPDEQHTGDMWNSNSLTSWLLVRSGHDLAGVRPPAGGRAPGWQAGLVAGSR